jgi:hypothetical protein
MVLRGGERLCRVCCITILAKSALGFESGLFRKDQNNPPSLEPEAQELPERTLWNRPRNRAAAQLSRANAGGNAMLLPGGRKVYNGSSLRERLREQPR